MIGNICYRTVLYITIHFLLFLGQRHFTIIRVCTGGGHAGTLAGRDLDGILPEGQRPHSLVRPPVSNYFFKHSCTICVIQKCVHKFLILPFIFLEHGGERDALPGGPLNITEEVATANKQDDPAEHAPLGAEEKVQ